MNNTATLQAYNMTYALASQLEIGGKALLNKHVIHVNYACFHSSNGSVWLKQIVWLTF